MKSMWGPLFFHSEPRRGRENEFFLRLKPHSRCIRFKIHALTYAPDWSE